MMSALALPEKDIERDIMAYLAIRGAVVVRTHSARNHPDIAGVADILACMHDGRFVAIEVKSAKGRVRPEQLHFLDSVRRAGGIAMVARDLDDVIAALGVGA